MRKLSSDDKIGQLSQIDIGMLFSDSNGQRQDALDEELVEKWIGEYGVGSILNTHNGDDRYWTASQYLRASRLIQDVARKHGRPWVLWGIDSVHGANYIYNATLTPQPVNIAASFNRTMAYEAGRIAAADTAAAGMHWVFSPLAGVAYDAAATGWSRIYEAYGEDPYVVGEMATQTVQGIQQQQQVAACAKHFVGYSSPRTGHDRYCIVQSIVSKKHSCFGRSHLFSLSLHFTSLRSFAGARPGSPPGICISISSLRGAKSSNRVKS